MGMGSAISKAGKKINDYISPAKLEKAKLFIVDTKSKEQKAITIQFNPSEYRISRGVVMAQKHAIGQDADIGRQQVVHGQLATLSVTLYFDTITDLYSLKLTDLKSGLSGMTAAGLKSAAMNIAKDQFGRTSNDNPATACDDVMSLVKYNHEQHAPNEVRFVWGKLDFKGRIKSSTVTYTMFDPNGTPVRAKVDLTMKGEETALTTKKLSTPPESPNRTKERTLVSGDQLWMMANEEYDNPQKWKVIAETNGILNPRKLDGVISLKVPSIK